MNPIFLKPLVAHMKTVMTSWWFLLVLVMHLPLFKELWTIYFNPFCTILSFSSSIISWSTIKLGRHMWHKWIRSYKSSTITNYSSNILNVIKWNILGTLVVKVEYVMFLITLRQWIYASPKDSQSLCGFLILTHYYRNFVKRNGKIAIPLTTLLNKNAFNCNGATK